MKKFLIVGLGNPGAKYTETRHNIGFKVLDEIAKEANVEFETEKLGDIARMRAKGRTFILLKPNTFMNLSGKAINYWLQKEKIEIQNTLVVTDDLNIDFGTIRIKAKGSAGGHNGVRSIISHLGTQRFSRLRLGIGRGFNEGIGHVLGKFCQDERSELEKSIKEAVLAVGYIAEKGLAAAMTKFNASPKASKNKSTQQKSPPKNDN